MEPAAVALAATPVPVPAATPGSTAGPALAVRSPAVGANAPATRPAPAAAPEPTIRTPRAARVAETAAGLAAGDLVLVSGAVATDAAALVVAAPFADAGAINLLAREAGGVVCLALTPERCARLGLRRMRERDEIRPGRDLLVTIEARDGTTTGISTADRARTVAAAIAPTAVPGDLVSPGHVVPLRTAAGGVLQSPGTAEATLDLLRIAGADPAAVHCTVLDEHGDAATGEHLDAIARRLGVPVVTVADVAAHLLDETAVLAA